MLFCGFSTAQEAQTTEEFGKKMLKSLQSNDPDMMASLAYQKDVLIETMEVQTTNEEVKAELSRELEREGFDRKMIGEMKNAHERLQKQEYETEKIDWAKTKFKAFKFQKNEQRTEMSGIEMGEGYLHFLYGGREYKLKMDKMAKLIVGWRGNELSGQFKLVYKNQ